MVKAVLFDMDGVLVDTEWFYNHRRVAYMEGRGYTFDEIPDLSGSNEKEIWETLVPGDEGLRERLMKGYFEYAEDHPVPYDELLNRDTLPVMQELKMRGIKCAIASSGSPKYIEELIEAAGICGVLDCYLSGHQCSAFKPNPEVYLRTMEMLGVTAWESLVVEDSPAGIEAGKRAGARVLALRPSEGVVLDQSGADEVIDSLMDILQRL